MKVVAIIQAHMSSSRLPGKVLLDLAGKPALLRVIERVRQFARVDEVVVAVSLLAADDILRELCNQWGVPVYRGDDRDVLSRFLGAAESAAADICVRITSDCPLIDPGVGDLIIERFLDADPRVDYASNKIPQSFPRGLDTEVFTIDALRRAARNAIQPYERAHVTIHMYEHPEQFRLLSVKSDVDRASWRWTLDTREDYAFMQSVYARMRSDRVFGWEEVLALLQREPELMLINAGVQQKDSREG
ncbi:MAG: glycosyltransferase family protein [Verrucomicrobia bacterium]|nr:glycosyltransferase family protein [Verrucomicrobiota bacterium]